MEIIVSGFITAEQIRAARAMLRWEQEELAEKIGPNWSKSDRECSV